MCGIAGVVGHVADDSGRSSVAQMMETMERRGPDSGGIEQWPGATLGHRRLAIFDLSPLGHQPMLSGDRMVGVVFNGAIYNFRSIRSELEGRGHAFRSATDTEILIAGYREWGIDRLVERLRGMFAFALWDAGSRTLFMVRDRLGVKPLAYTCADGTLAFASTVRALRAGGHAGAVEPRAVAEYLENGYVPETHAIVDSVSKLPPGTLGEWHDGRLRLRRYWDAPTARPAGRHRFGDAVDEAESLLLRAVALRLDADVPVGALLSGGIDSALVCWAIARLGRDVTAYTVGTPQDPEDESEAATETARTLGIKHEVLSFDDVSGTDLEHLTSAYAEPFACTSAIGLLRICGAIAPSATVLLTGDGGDDAFLGYPRHRHLLWSQRVAALLPSATDRWWLSTRAPIPRRGLAKRAVNFLEYSTGGLGAFLDANDGLPAFAAADLLGERLHDATISTRGRPRSLAEGRRVLAAYLDHDRSGQFVGEYLTKVDGAAMFHSIEARSPFLDQELWEFAARLPYDCRLHRGRLKAILREIARRNIGAAIARRRKQGFLVPADQWVASRRGVELIGRLEASHLVRDGWIRAAGLHKLAVSTSLLDRATTRRLWYLLVLDEWMRSEPAPVRTPRRSLASAGGVPAH